MTFAIRTDRLTKYYGAKCVVDGLKLQAPAGTVYGFLGRNGAGKSTTIRMLLAMLQPFARWWLISLPVILVATAAMISNILLEAETRDSSSGRSPRPPTDGVSVLRGPGGLDSQFVLRAAAQYGWRMSSPRGTPGRHRHP